MCTTSPSWILKTCWFCPPLTTIKMQSASGFKVKNIWAQQIFAQSLWHRDDRSTTKCSAFTVTILAMNFCISTFGVFCWAWPAWCTCVKWNLSWLTQCDDQDSSIKHFEHSSFASKPCKSNHNAVSIWDKSQQYFLRIVYRQTAFDFSVSVILQKHSVCDKPLTYSHNDCACGNHINQKNFEVHQACSSDEDDFNTIHHYLKKTQVIRWINTSCLWNDWMSHNCKFCCVK